MVQFNYSPALVPVLLKELIDSMPQAHSLFSLIFTGSNVILELLSDIRDHRLLLLPHIDRLHLGLVDCPLQDRVDLGPMTVVGRI